MKKGFGIIIHSQYINWFQKLFCLWFFIRNYVHLVNYLFFLVLMPVMIWIPRTTVFEWAAIYLPAFVSITNLIYTKGSWIDIMFYVLFENSMSLFKVI